MKKKQNMIENSNLILRVAFPYVKPVNFYDPLKIHLSPEYTFLENTFSPLVEYTPKGELVSALAGSFNWVGNEAHFKIRADIKTVDGHIINARDAEITFKRMMIIQGNTHGDLKNMLCPDAVLKNLDDICPNMEVRENDTTLVLKFNEKKIFLFSMLAAIDFAIIPRNSIDPHTLAIIDYRNTSGPYFVEKDNGNGFITLSSNPNHFHFSSQMPQKLYLIPAGLKDPSESLQLFSEKKVDLITTIDHVSHDKVIPYARENSDISTLHTTWPLRIYGIAFTEKGLKRFSISERIAISKKIRTIFLASLASKEGYEPSEQLFSIMGESSLSKEQIKNVQDKYNDVPDKNIINNDMLGWIVRLSNFNNDDKSLKNAFPNLKLLHINKVPNFTDFSNTNEKEPDFFISGPDTGFLEDIGLLSYCINAGFLALPLSETNNWLRKYMSIEDKSKRLELIKDLHYKTLMDAVTIPMAVSPYVALIRKPWVFNISKVQASDAIWRIYHP